LQAKNSKRRFLPNKNALLAEEKAQQYLQEMRNFIDYLVFLD